MSSDGLRDVATRAVSSAYCGSWTWCEGVGMSIAYRLNSTGETSPARATSTLMTRRVDMADWKDVWNVIAIDPVVNPAVPSDVLPGRRWARLLC
jgi:hypothetical protein